MTSFICKCLECHQEINVNINEMQTYNDGRHDYYQGFEEMDGVEFECWECGVWIPTKVVSYETIYNYQKQVCNSPP